jgi:arabinofuranosyltransferase
MSSLEKKLLPVVVVAAVIALYLGWKLTWFLTDDAFIFFRYVVNSTKGFGYVWNPPPFRPVEGYTSFLWVFLLDGVWRLSSVAPPQSSTLLSFGFTLLTLLLGIGMAWRLPWNAALKPYRLGFIVLLLAGVLGNRTFLTWGSSGLETGLFNFTLTLWVALALFVAPAHRWWGAAVASAATLAYLTRPDGLLYAAATVALLGIVGIRGGRRSISWGVGSFLPFVLIPLHFLWRYQFYGAWLPNTYYSKVTDSPYVLESGLRYLLSFIIEYGWWSLVLIGLWWLVQRWQSRREWLPTAFSIGTLSTGIVVATVAAHIFYYTFIVGGDHFEFRVYSHLILFLFLALLGMLNHIGLRARTTAAILLVVVLFSFPIQWYHWMVSESYTTRDSTLMFHPPLADHAQRDLPLLPSPIVQYLAWYDDQQGWLIEHFVGMRQREHAIFVQANLQAETLAPWNTPIYHEDEMLVIVAGAVGVISYMRHDAAILDEYGLNDYVTARYPVLREGYHMAHDRQPPPQYIACFMGAGRRIGYVRLSQIVLCERQFATAITEMN